jgi:hypothetical protein
MKAFVCEKYDPPDVLQIKDVHKPIPKDNKVLIKLHATTCHIGDMRVRHFHIPYWQKISFQVYLGLIKPKRPLLVLFVMALLISGLMMNCGFVLTGSGELESKEYPFHDFNSVEISSAFEYEISQSGEYGVTVSADDNVIENVQVTEEGNNLKIGLKTTPRLGSLTLKTVVTMPDLRGLTISGASHGTISGFYSVNDINIKVSGAGKVSGNITADGVDFNISGASTVVLEGSANNVVADVSGASRLNLVDFLVNNADVTLSGASSGTVNLSGKLDANLSGASKLTYIGEPVMGNINTSGASTLRKK